MWCPLELVKFDSYNHIYGPDNFFEEFSKTVLDLDIDTASSSTPSAQSKQTKQYVGWLLRSLTLLNEAGVSATRLKGFEKLSGTGDLYSVKYPHTGKNPRILYFFVQGQNVILLYSFLEKNKGDYQRAINVAEQRKKLLLLQWPLDETGGSLW